jgi:hypothetical protein
MTLMTDQELLIDLDDVEGHAGLRITDDSGWLKERLGRGPEARRVTLKAADDDVEGHAAGTSVALRVFSDDDDTEGHAISVHFPTRDDADAFRRRLLLTGVLAGTIAVGTVAGVGLANLPADDAGTGSAAVSGAAAGMDWTQMERPLAAGAVSEEAAGMDWTQMERPITGAGISAAGTSEYDWTDMERPITAPAAEEAPDIESDAKGPAPR